MDEVSVGEPFFSAFLQPLFDRISSAEFSHLFDKKKLDETLLNDMKENMLIFHAFIQDAVAKELESRQVQWWLDEYKEVNYELEDLLDEIVTEGLICKLEADQPRSIRTRFRSFMSTTFISVEEDRKFRMKAVIDKGIEYRMKAVAAKIRDLMTAKDVVGLQKASILVREPCQLSVATDCIAEDEPVPPQVYGRDGDKKAIIKLLLSDGVSASGKIDVIALVGRDGVGKTTLADLVYNDELVKKHFDFMTWIQVLQDADNLSLTKAIFQAFTYQYSDVEDLNSLQVRLKGSLKGRKLLLVLDELWFEYFDWKPVLKAGASGSKIIITTSKSRVAASMGALSFSVNVLTTEDCWKVFAKLAFTDKKSYPKLRGIGQKIVKKSNGLPLAAKVLGSLMRFKPRVEDWVALQKNNIWNSDENSISSILKVSYYNLPVHLKRCVAYCSIFPTHHEYEEDKLVLLWMAEGFLEQKQGKRMEEVGHEYFRNLTNRSFFQPFGTRFIMHDLLKDLVNLEYEVICSRLTNNNEDLNLSSKTRHLLIYGGKYIAERCMAICELAMFLRTLILYKSPWENQSYSLSHNLLDDMFITLQRLRVLSLSRFRIDLLPDSIGRLRHLRYLDLSYSAITRLPDTIGALYNLQTLLLSCCFSLIELPEKTGNLINLRHLDIRRTLLKEMPPKMGSLTSLQSLSNFVVGKYCGSTIKELGPLSNLRETLHLSQLENVGCTRDASDACLENKRDLQGLTLEWSHITEKKSLDETDLLEQLEPHKNLEKLTIISYSGIRSPTWLGDPLFSKMVFLRLSNCRRCSHLPSLGQLPSLKCLYIEQMNGVRKIESEFYRTSYSSAKPFPSLEILDFWKLLNWEEWISPEDGQADFPCLKQISIRECPKLVRCTSLILPSWTKVQISECPLLRVPITDGFRSDEKLADRSSRLPVIDELQLQSGQLKSDDETASLWTDDLTTSSSYQSGSSGSLPKIPVWLDLQLRKGNKAQIRSEEKVLDRPSTSRLPEVEELQLLDSNLVQRTETSITSNSPSPEIPKRLTEDSSAQGGASDNSSVATEMSSDDSDTNHPINIWYAQDSLEDNSSPEPDSLTVSEISKLQRLPSKLYSLKIEGCDSLKSLPEDLMHSNAYLQHLYIIDCHFLKSIHGSHLPVALKTLYIRECKKLEFLFPIERIGKHTSLEHLCIESSCDSLKSVPLAFFPKLKNLSISDCANFSSISITEDHMSLVALEIRDCAKLESFSERGLCTPNLTSILLSNCKILKLLPGQLHRLTSLQSLIVNECPKLDSLPEGGLPSSLNFVCISSCHRLTPCIEWGLYRLSTFSRIDIEGGCTDLESFPEQNLLPRNLNSLRISRLPNLKVFDYKGLQHLTSLETLKINSCNKLQSFPEEGLPSSLTYLYITDCPLLKSKLESRRGKEWYKIAHIPHIQIDMEVISLVSLNNPPLASAIRSFTSHI